LSDLISFTKETTIYEKMFSVHF